MGVAEVLLGVGLVDSAREGLGVVRVGPHLLALVAEDGGGAGVLAEGQDATGGDLGVAEESEGDVAVVVRRLGVLEDGGDLLKV